MKMRFTVATRVYMDESTGLICRDRLVRAGRNKFYLIEEPDSASGREVSRPLSLDDVFDWYRIEPWQITRTLVSYQRAHDRQRGAS
ncbi:hypothetical protein ACVWY3_001616 [Bradyrhizobium sp. USDA 4486]